ncbi:EpsG family protein [Gelidibacter pelagius]|uniref:EpsG family protein n=1 Tax=Gelidibacter pelagius TaxID=2819985 RepID=A0ABS3SWT0_9FLAO|nr:EpsG family protein [Gelidibacter pelagius]MBO3100180.1 EpsG family protein [Gelidibacter pelagius]
MAQVDKKIFLALWIFNPFVSAIYLFKNFKQNRRIYPYLFLSFFFGLSFVVSTTGADSERYALQLLQYHRQNISLFEVIGDFYNEEGTKLDIYQPLVTWFISLFTDNVKVLFAFFALVFGYFWFKSLLLIRSHIQIPLKGLVLLTFLFLAFTNPIWLINGVRMWTAVGCFFYGLVVLHLEKDKKGWFYLVLPMFIHFSLIIALVVYILYVIIPYKNKTILFFAAFLFTFFLGELDLDIFRSYFEQAPEFLEKKGSYLNEDYVERVSEAKEQFAFHVILARHLSRYSILAITILMYYYYSRNKRKITDDYFNVIFTLGLFFASFSNLASNIPSGGRFVVLSNLIVLTAFLFLLNQRIRMNRAIKLLLSGSIIFVIIFRIREGLDYIGPFFFIGNPVVNWFVEDITLIDAIKSLL